MTNLHHSAVPHHNVPPPHRYFNATMAKSFRWTMKGKPLVA
ncbi:MAG TPA: hypothetical protein VM715_20470 [Candidatus Acidoferrum sp.]|nr:hypothetical protein [Candidatus Acidoferrum sp.]